MHNQAESIWSQSCAIKERPPLPGGRETEVAVVGAGLAGLLTAYLLQEAGKQVLVLEAGRIAGGQTQNTTAKITSQHGLIYHSLTEAAGAEKARQYARANEEAINGYRRLIEREGIDCGFEEKCAYVYGLDAVQLREEAECAAALGLPADFVETVPIPVEAAGAVRFAKQAQFHPLKFIRSIAERLTVYEQTPVKKAAGNLLVTGRGEVRAQQIVFACHFPFINFPGMYFARMHQERSYVLALENAARVDGMYIGAGENSYSFRNAGELLLFGGENHRTGENREGGRYEALRRKAQELFPGSLEVAHWSAQDCIPADGVPYIGRYSAGTPDWYVATGFQKWGMTSSMAAAMLLRDRLCGRDNPCAGVFDPTRFTMEGAPKIAAEGGQAVKGLVKQLFQLPSETAAQLEKGHGGIVFLDGEKLGVYKDGTGEIHAVDIRCPHLGCQLEWNPDELSWDCPCHGSRFDYSGQLIANPAQEDIRLG